ncbi:MAG: response regulator [Bdellovibrionales bacterium]|nr:response regulator [Bdellovibrionales bacterium]
MEKTDKIKLVVADDAPFIREIIRQIAKGDESLVLVGEAQDGEDVIEVVSCTRPDVILMDIVMPKKNGIEATKIILEKYPKIKVIAFSTLDDESMLLKALDAGCCNYLKKPFDAQSVKKIIYNSILGESA